MTMTARCRRRIRRGAVAIVAVAASLISVPGAPTAQAQAPVSYEPLPGNGLYVPLTPARLLDTRNATGGHQRPFAQAEMFALPVLGTGGIPTEGVSAVVLNVTVDQPSAPGFLTVFPAGQPLPVASNLNFTPGQTVPNMVVSKVSSLGAIAIYNNAGTAHVIVDVVGYFSDALENPVGASYASLPPARIFDTRNGVGGRTGRLGQQQTVDVQITGQGGVPLSGVTGVALNVTVDQPTAPSFLTVWPTGEPLPLASNLNWVAGQTVPNMVIAKVGTNGRVSVFNNAGEAHVVIDVVGYFTSTASTGQHISLTPRRLLDTRSSSGALGQGRQLDLQVVGIPDVPELGVDAVVLNVTVDQPTAPSFLTVYPSGGGLPLASNLNYVAGQTVPNMVIAKVGANGRISIYNNAGSAHVIVDLVGYITGAVPNLANRGRTQPLLVSEWFANPFNALDPDVATGPPDDRRTDVAAPVTEPGPDAAQSLDAVVALLDDHLDTGVPVPPDGAPGVLASVNGFPRDTVSPTVGLLLQFGYQIGNPSNVQLMAQCSGTLVAPDAVLTAYHCIRFEGPAGFAFSHYAFVPGIHGASAPYGVFLTPDPGWFLLDAQNLPDPYNLLDLYPPLDYAVISFPAHPASTPPNVAPGNATGAYSDVLLEPPGGPRFTVGYPGDSQACDVFNPDQQTCLQQFCFSTVQSYVDYTGFNFRGGQETELDCTVIAGMSGGPEYEVYNGTNAVAGLVSNGLTPFLFGPYFEYDPANGDIIDLLIAAGATL